MDLSLSISNDDIKAEVNETSNVKLNSEITKTSINSTNDTLIKPNEVVLKNQISDSTLSISIKDSAITSIPLAILPSPTNWLISMRSGVVLSKNKLNPSDFLSKESDNYFVNLELSYSFKTKYSISGGLQLNSSNYELSHIFPIEKQIPNGYDSSIIKVPGPDVLDSNMNPIPGDSIFQTITTPKYILSTEYYSARQVYNLTSIGVPINFGYSFSIKNNLYFDGFAGLILNYQQAKLKSTDPLLIDPTIRNFGLKIMFRPQIRYQLNHFGISLNSNFGFDSKPSLNWQNIQQKRFYTELGIGFHYKF
jgi:hypothetical protein